MTETYSFPIGQLVVSPLNVRTNMEDANSVDALASSIAVSGLLFPLIVHRIDLLLGSEHEAFAIENAGSYGVLAGGRRLRAMRQLVEAGTLPEDHPVDCLVRDGTLDQIIELSLSENLLRRELRLYEVHAAIAAAADKGATPEEIAATCGQRVAWVRQQLRLGNLAPEIFEAYRGGYITAELANAYAATEDRELQQAAFAAMANVDRHQHTAQRVRAFYKVGDREHERFLAFVGDAVYRANGGRFELDLFADGPERGRIVDEELLRGLVEEKLAGERARIRELAQERDLRFLPEPPTFGQHVDHTLELHNCEKRSGGYRLPAPDIVATIAIDEDGRASPRFWWPSRKAKGDAERGKAGKSAAPTVLGSKRELDAGDVLGNRGSDYEKAARGHIREEHGFSADGLQVVRSTRRMLLRSILATDAAVGGTLGRDYLTWSQLRHELTDDRDAAIGARAIASEWNGRDAEPREIAHQPVAAQPGGRQWEALLAACAALDPFRLEDPADAFEAFVDLTEAEKNRCTAIVAGLALLRSCAAVGYAIPVHDRIADLASAADRQLRRFWEPDSAFVGMLPKLRRLELAEPFVGTAQTADWSKLSDREITRAAAGALQDQAGWVHPLLSFGVAAPDYPQPDQATPMLEAAE